MQSKHIVFISGDNPSEAKVTSLEGFNALPRSVEYHYEVIYSWEDAQRFARRRNVMLQENAKLSQPTKKLYVVISNNPNAPDEICYVLWAHSKAEVIEYLRKQDADWWRDLELHLKLKDSKYTDEVLETLHPFEVLDQMGDGDNRLFSIEERYQPEILDIRTKKRRRHAL